MFQKSTTRVSCLLSKPLLQGRAGILHAQAPAAIMSALQGRVALVRMHIHEINQ